MDICGGWKDLLDRVPRPLRGRACIPGGAVGLRLGLFWTDARSKIRRLIAARAAPPQDFVLIRISNQAGKHATLAVKGDLLVAPKAQAAEYPATGAPRRQLELERRGFKTKVEPV